MAEIETLQMSFQLGLLYTIDATKDNPQENLDKLNSRPWQSQDRLFRASLPLFCFQTAGQNSFDLS